MWIDERIEELEAAAATYDVTAQVHEVGARQLLDLADEARLEAQGLRDDARRYRDLLHAIAHRDLARVGALALELGVDICMRSSGEIEVALQDVVEVEHEDVVAISWRSR